MPPKRIYLSPPDVGPLERQLLLDAFDSNWIAPLGPHVDAFERELSERVGGLPAVALSTGTAGLELGLRAVGVRPGDVVLVSTFTFAASAFAVCHLGAEPAFVDSETVSWNMDPERLEQAIACEIRRGKKPAAIVCVDLYGQCADYNRLRPICHAHGIPIVQDAADSLGAVFYPVSHSEGEKDGVSGRLIGEPAGRQGDLAVFSFNGNKIITTSGGGMLVSSRKEWVDRIRHWATQARDPAPHYEHSEIGHNYRLSNLLAAVGRGQLQSLDRKIERRRTIFDLYTRLLGNLPGLSFMPIAGWGVPNYWLTCITIDPARFGCDRETIRLALESENIESRPLWKPMHLQPVFADHRVYGGQVSEGLFQHGLCLPSGSSLTDEDVARVAAVVCGAVRR
jgi:dTDP-4-amino-4,6-dideoxygalactose transaminase